MGKEFVIRWEVDKVSELTGQNQFSPIHNHANVPWNLSLRKERVENRDRFIMFLRCNEDSAIPLWSVQHNSTVILVNRQNTDKNESVKIKNVFNNNVTSWGHNPFIPHDIMDVEQGYIQDDKILLEAHISVEEVRGIKELVEFDFSQPKETSDNVILRVEGENFHVSKGYLSTQSPFFYSLFYGEFKEKSQSEIELGDVTAKDFHNFLLIAFPTNMAVTVDTYKSVLALSDRYTFQYAAEKVEQYLMKTSKVTISVKLLIAGQFNLCYLKMQCINSLGTTEAVKALQKTPEFTQFSDHIHRMILEKLLALLN